MNPSLKPIVADFVKYCQTELNMQELPSIKLITDKNWVAQNRSFGEYNPEQRSIKVYYANRNTADILRSLAHELVHHRQEELGMIEAMSGETGSEIENEANAMAGILLRGYGKQNIKIYDLENV
jgi:Zn-dependent peptidase ImmA (M78 family)